MNLHPIFVHFPIALLTIYSLMELVRFKKLLAQPYWFYAKALFLMMGGLGALAAYFTGGFARAAVWSGEFNPAVQNFDQVVRLHEAFAQWTVVIFGILAAAYLVMWLERINFGNLLMRQSSLISLWRWLVKIARFAVETPLVIFLAIAGLIVITMTGGLGGIMVYGPNADPFFGVVYKILFPQ